MDEAQLSPRFAVVEVLAIDIDPENLKEGRDKPRKREGKSERERRGNNTTRFAKKEVEQEEEEQDSKALHVRWYPGEREGGERNKSEPNE